MKKISLIFSILCGCASITFSQVKPAKPAKLASTPQTNKLSKATTKSTATINQQMVTHPAWSANNTIYEVNLRQYAKDASFKNFEKELPRLKKMGVGILWFMPIHPIGVKGRKGTLGSYYAVKDYLAVSDEYGTMQDFNHMVQAIHASGMKIIIDWVANHTAPDNAWTKQHPDFYTKDKNNNFVPPVADWSDVIDLNYDNKQMRIAMIGAMKYWLTKADVDGFRCDVAEMVPTDFWIDCRKELDKVKPVFMLAEGEKPELHQAFDMTYTWSFYHTMKGVISGEKKRADIVAYFQQQQKEYKPNYLRMYFTSNHDENTWNATEFEAFKNAHKAVAAMTATLPGMPLIYSGQESAQPNRLKFFDKDVIEWGNYTYAQFYTTLMKLHLSSRSLSPTSKMEIIDVKNDNLFAYKRISASEETLVIVNLNNGIETLNIAENIAATFTNAMDGSTLELKQKTDLTFEGYQFFVLQRNLK